MAIHALITTRLDYCNSLYLGISKSSIACLQLVQNAAAKFLKGQRKFDHVTPILKLLHWLPVHLRIEFKILLYVFKSINNLAPSYLSDQLYPYNPTRNLRSGDQRLLFVPSIEDSSPNSSPNTNDLYIHYIDKSIGTPPSLEQKNDGNIIHVFKNCISISVATVLEVSKMTVHICTNHWCLVMSFWLKVCIYSHTRGVKLGLGLGFMQTSQVLPY